MAYDRVEFLAVLWNPTRTKAFDSGYAGARFLVAQTIDRYLSLTEGKQK